MKKRYTALSIALLTAVSLSACTGSEVPDAAPTAAPTEAESTPVEAEATPAEAESAPTQAPTEAPAAESDLPAGIVKVNLTSPLPLPENEALAFVKDMKAGWNLGNCFDAFDCNWLSDPMDYETAWCKAKATKELMLELKAQGFNSVRIPV